MNVLVVGGTGFIGKAVVEECLRLGWSVTAVTRPGRAGPLRRLHTGGVQLRILERCIHEPLLLSGSGAFDAVINLVGPGRDSWEANWQANVEHVRYLVELLRRISVGRLVHFSSISVYGITGRPANCIIREEDELRPDDWYGLTKVLGERIIRVFHEDTGVPVAVLRPSWVIGRGSRLLDRHLLMVAQSGLLVRMLRQVPLNAIYVRDAALAGVLAASKGLDGFEVYNINVLGDQRFGDLIDALRSEVPGFKVPIVVPTLALRLLARVFGSLRFLLSGVSFDASKARDKLGFVPRHDIRSAIHDMVYGGDAERHHLAETATCRP